MTTVTAKTAAMQIVSQMSDDDKTSFSREKWQEGVGNMLVDEWSLLELMDVLDEIEIALEND